MKLNTEWHRAHPMPPKATFEERVEWHREHLRECGCRKPPADIADVLEREAAAPPGAKRIHTRADIR